MPGTGIKHVSKILYQYFEACDDKKKILAPSGAI
jgi:hypothetical protein